MLFIGKNKQVTYKKNVHEEYKMFSCDLWAIVISTDFALQFDTQYLGLKHAACCLCSDNNVTRDGGTLALPHQPANFPICFQKWFG